MAKSTATNAQMIFECLTLRKVTFHMMEVDTAYSTVEGEMTIRAVEQSVNDAATQLSQTLKER